MAVLFPPKFQPFFPVKSIFTSFLQVALLLFSLSQVATAQSSPPVIDRQPYRVLYNTAHEPVGEWPPIGIIPARVDASSLVNIGCAIDLRIVASGPDLSYQWKKGSTNIPGANGPQLYINVISLNDAGLYRCEVTNPYGSVLSMAVRMGVVDISNSNRILAAGSTASASFSASYKFPTAIGGFRFQWFKMVGTTPDLNNDVMLDNDATYSGATTATLGVKVPNTASAGTFYCRITAYNTYILTGYRNLGVVPTPAPTMVQLGDPLQFSVTPVGPPSTITGLAYQWNKAGVAIPDENASSLIIGSAEAGDAGLYSVSVTHPTIGTFTTPQAVALVVDPAVTVLNVVGGMKADLIAPPAFNKSQTFQWFRNGNLLSNGGRVSNATTAKLTIASAVASDGGEYECRSTLYGGTVVVARPVLIVTERAQSKAVALGDVLELEVSPAYGDSSFVDPGLFSFQWVKGTGTSALVLDGETNPTLTIASTAATDFGQYTCRVSYNGSLALATQLANVAVVNTSLRAVNVNAGKSAALSAVVFAPRGVTFQWSFEDSPLDNSVKYAGVTTNKFAVNAAAVADAGIYQCSVSFPGGTSVTAPVQLVVYSRPEILNLEFPPAIVGGAFNYQITVSDDPLYIPTGYDATPLPKGLVINKLTGAISGTPTVFGTYSVLVSAKNAVGTTTQTATLTVSALPSRFVGRFIAALPRMPEGEFGNLGGRLDLLVATTGICSGSLTVGATKHSFAGTLAVSGTDPLTATASATINVVRTAGNLTLSFDLLDDDYLYGGQITGAGNTLNFNGWRAIYTLAQPPSVPSGVYNMGLFPQSPMSPPAPVPQGTGYATLAIPAVYTSDLTAGNYTMVTTLPDDTTFTTAAFVGPAGELLAYGYLYGTLGGGSVVSTGTTLAINGLAPGAPVTGELTWTRPANTTRRFKEGFSGLELAVSGGLYTTRDPTVDRLISSESGQLTFEGGGIELASRNPDAAFSIALGNALPTRTSANPALTVFKGVSVPSGAFNGSFALADDNPTTVLVSPTEFTRSVNFKGLTVPIDGTQVGVGFFILPQIPTVSPLTTTTNSPELSGSVQFDAIVP